MLFHRTSAHQYRGRQPCNCTIPQTNEHGTGSDSRTPVDVLKTITQSSFVSHGTAFSYVTARGGGGQVKGVFVKRGDIVPKGKLLLKLDDAIQRQAVIAAEQGLETLKTHALDGV